MAMVKIRVLEDRFQADLWQGAFDDEKIPCLVRSYQDTAYDGIYVSQKGFASIWVEEEDQERAQALDRALMEQINAQEVSPEPIAHFLDHTLLDPNAGPEELDKHLAQCLEMGCAAACISPWMVETAVQALGRSPVQVCTVIGFPLGADTGQSKLNSALELAGLGATELDVVFNRGLALGGRLDEAVAQMDELARSVAPATVKVILETSQMGPDLSYRAAQKLAETPVSYLKTGSGYFGGATVSDVKLLREACQDRLEIKAAGGIKTLEQARQLLEAGAHRLGTSSGYAIWQEATLP